MSEILQKDSRALCKAWLTNSKVVSFQDAKRHPEEYRILDDDGIDVTSEFFLHSKEQFLTSKKSSINDSGLAFRPESDLDSGSASLPERRLNVSNLM